MSEPSASGTIRQASAAAAPPLLPPALFDRSYGLRVAPNTSLTVCEPVPNSGVFVLPSAIPPASRMRRTSGSSSVGTWSANAREPYVVRTFGGVGEVLVRDRDAVQRAAHQAAPQVLVGACGLVERALGGQRHDGVDPRVRLLHAPQARLGQLDGAHLARPQQRGHLRRGEVGQLVHGSPVRCGSPASLTAAEPYGRWQQ